MWGSWKSDDRRIEFILETAEGSNHEVLEVANFRIQEDYTAKPISSVFLKASRWQRWYFCFKQFIGKFSFHWSVKVLAITFGSIVNVVSMSWSHFWESGDLRWVFGEFFANHNKIGDCSRNWCSRVCCLAATLVTWPPHLVFDHASSLKLHTLTMKLDERVSVIFDQCEHDLSTDWLRMKHYCCH